MEPLPGSLGLVRTHGTHSCYCGGCRCEPCRKGHSAYVSDRARQDYQPITIDAAPFRTVLLALWKLHTISDIARVSHLSHATIRAVMDGKRQRIWVRTAACIRVAAAMLPSGVAQ